MSILIFGHVRWDVVASGAALPGAGAAARAKRLTGRPGGAAALAALAAAGAGGRAVLAGAVGADHAGRLLRGALRRAGIDLDEMDRLDIPTGQGLGLEAAGELRLMVLEGANARASGQGVRLAPDLRVALVANEVDAAANLSLLRRLPRGTREILHLARADLPPGSVLGRLDLVLAEAEVARALTGREGAAAARALAAQVPAALVLGEGAWFADAAGVARIEGAAGEAAAYAGRLAAALDAGTALPEAAATAMGG
jgi:ribokinase